MDYKDIAKEVDRSPTTVRKWCSRITELSGYQFTFKKIYRGRNKEPLKQFVFKDDDLIKFKELAKLLSETNDFNYSVYEVYGNLKAKRERDLRKDIDDLDDYCLSKFENLVKQINTLKTNNQLLNNTKNGARKKLSYLITVFNSLMNYGLVNENLVKRVGNIPVEKITVDYWTVDEFKQFIYSLDCSLYFEQFIFTMIWLYFYTGIRVSEGLALYWSDIDLKKQKMSISHNLDYANKHNWERKNKLKTEKSKRVISIDDTTVEVLKDWRKRQKEFSEQFEFVLSYDLTPNDAHFVRDMITKYSKRAGVRSIQAKALRHSHASLLINEYNVTPLLIQKRLGHTDIRTTLGIYSHLYPNADEEITGQLKDLIKINK